MASVWLMPAATLVRRRSLPPEQNDMVLATVLVEPQPIATEFEAMAPTAIDPEATASVPIAIALVPYRGQQLTIKVLVPTWDYARQAV
jgi:hypothetical protein